MVTVAGVKPAANLMISFDLIQFWLKFSANSQVMLQSRTAARRKPAARRQVNQVRHRARDHIQAVCNLSQDRDRCNQALGIGVERFIKQRLYSSLFNNPPGIHHRHPVSHFRNYAQVVRN